MGLFGHICLGLAFLLFLFNTIFVARYVPGRGGDMRIEHFLIETAIVIVLWLLLAGVLLAVFAKGGFAWLRCGPKLQFVAVLAAWISMGAVTWFSGALYHESAGQIPLAARPFIPWAIYVVPLVTIGFGSFALRGSAFSAGASFWWRFPFALVAAISVAAGIGILAELLVKHRQRRANSAQSFHFNTERENRR